MSILKSCVAVLGFVLSLSGAVANAAPYTFDKGHTEIIFTYSHVGNSTSYVSFNDYDGVFDLDVDKPENSAIDVTIQMASIDSGLAEFDEHLRGKDFFHADKYPTARFVSTGIKAISKSEWQVTGDLTIKGVTRSVALVTQVNYVGPHPLGKFIKKYKHDVVGVSLSGQLLRSDFDVGLHAPLVGDKVELIIETELLAKP